MTSSCHSRVACAEHHGVIEREFEREFERKSMSASLFHAKGKAIITFGCILSFKKVEGKGWSVHLHALATTERLISRVFMYDGI